MTADRLERALEALVRCTEAEHHERFSDVKEQLEAVLDVGCIAVDYRQRLAAVESLFSRAEFSACLDTFSFELFHLVFAGYERCAALLPTGGEQLAAAQDAAVRFIRERLFAECRPQECALLLEHALQNATQPLPGNPNDDDGERVVDPRWIACIWPLALRCRTEQQRRSTLARLCALVARNTATVATLARRAASTASATVTVDDLPQSSRTADDGNEEEQEEPAAVVDYAAAFVQEVGGLVEAIEAGGSRDERALIVAPLCLWTAALKLALLPDAQLAMRPDGQRILAAAWRALDGDVVGFLRRSVCEARAFQPVTQRSYLPAVCTSFDDDSEERRCPRAALGLFFYYALCGGDGGAAQAACRAQIAALSPVFVLRALLPLAAQLIGTASVCESGDALRHSVNDKGVRLLAAVLRALPDGTVAAHPAQLVELVRTLSVHLIDVCSFCPRAAVRARARHCFRTLLSVFEPPVRYQLLAPFLDRRSSPAAALSRDIGLQAQSYYIARLKDEYVAAFAAADDSVFFRRSGKILTDLAQIVAELDLSNVDCLDTCLQILNFYRFLLLRDRSERLTDIYAADSPAALRLDALDALRAKLDAQVEALRQRIADPAARDQELHQMRQLGLPVSDLTAESIENSLVAKEHRYLLVLTVLCRTREILQENI